MGLGNRQETRHLRHPSARMQSIANAIWRDSHLGWWSEGLGSIADYLSDLGQDT